MQSPQNFPAAAANSLIEGYCDDFVALAASMAQTLEQISMRALPMDGCADKLVRVEHGMRQLADAIGALLASSPTGAPRVPPAARERQRQQTHERKRDPKAPAKPATLPTPPPRPGPRAMPVAPADGLPPADEHVRRPAAETVGGTAPVVDATRLPARPSSSMLTGSNDTMPLRSVFQFLSRMRKSGTLRVVLEDEELSFEISDGILVATKSTRMQQDERLGDLLIELGFLAPMDLEVFVKLHGQSLRQLGGALVQAGRLTEGQLAEALERQVQRRFQRAVGAIKASYDFRESPRPRGDGRIRIRTFEMLGGGDEPGT